MRGIGKKKMKDNQIEEEIQKTIQIKRDRKRIVDRERETKNNKKRKKDRKRDIAIGRKTNNNKIKQERKRER